MFVYPIIVELAFVVYLKWALNSVFKSFMADLEPIMHRLPGITFSVKFVNLLVELTDTPVGFTHPQLMNLYLLVEIDVLLKSKIKALTFLKS